MPLPAVQMGSTLHGLRRMTLLVTILSGVTFTGFSAHGKSGQRMSRGARETQQGRAACRSLEVGVWLWLGRQTVGDHTVGESLTWDEIAPGDRAWARIAVRRGSRSVAGG